MMIETLWTAASWVVSASWKGSILILLIAPLLWIAGDRIPARWRYALGLVVLLRLALPITPASSLSLFNLLDLPPRHLAVVDLRPESIPAPSGPLAPEPPLLEVIWPPHDLTLLANIGGWIWLAGLAVLGVRLAVASVRLHWRLRREPVFELPPAAVVLLRQCRQELGIEREVELRETDQVRSPALHGILRPLLLLPHGLTDAFNAEELRFIFLHELAHLKRFDVLVNWMISLVQIIHWFNPLVWLATLRMREERELACDELALSCLQQEERPGYGRTILKLLDRFRTPLPVPGLLGILDDKHQMKRRLLMITRFRTHRSSLFFLALVTGLAAVSLTDARAGEGKRLIRRLDPAAQATLEKLDQVVSFELTDATLSTVLAEITVRTGVPITPNADLPAEVWQKRITIQADQVPAHAILIETLGALGLGFDLGADGVAVEKSEGIRRMLLMKHPGEPGAIRERKMIRRSAEPDNEEFEVLIETNGRDADGKRVIQILEADRPAEEGVHDRIFIRKMLKNEQETNDDDGSVRRNFVLRRIENGQETQGFLRLQIRPAD